MLPSTSTTSRTIPTGQGVCNQTLKQSLSFLNVIDSELLIRQKITKFINDKFIIKKEANKIEDDEKNITNN